MNVVSQILNLDMYSLIDMFAKSQIVHLYLYVVKPRMSVMRGSSNRVSEIDHLFDFVASKNISFIELFLFAQWLVIFHTHMLMDKDHSYQRK